MAVTKGMHEEYELKLAVSPEQLEKLSRHPLLRSLTQDRKAATRLVSTYYDTPAGLLHKRAMALRVREAGDTRTQTLKVKGDQDTGLQHFHEYEATLPGDRPDLDRVNDPQLKALFADIGLAAQIGPVFTTDFARRKILLRLFDSEIELALDHGAIISGEQTVPICEAELELVSGRPSRIFELALTLRDSVPFRLEFRTKAGRGYALALNEPVAPVAGKKPVLSREQTAGQAFYAIARACRDQIQGNEPAVLRGLERDGDPEGVHQMRVGIRRLRAALRAFRPIMAPEALAYLKAELNWLQSELGPARDWDVFVAETLPPIQAALPEETGFESVFSAAMAARRQAYERGHAAIADTRYVCLLLRLNLWLEEGTMLDGTPRGDAGAHQDVPTSAGAASEPILAFATRVLRRCDKKMRRTGRNPAALTTEQLHELRIEAKKLRYAIEFFKTLYSESAVKRTLEILVAIQDSLGALNDSVICQALLKDLRVRSALDTDFSKPVTERATGLIAGWQAAALAHRIENFGELWAAYRKAKPFWARPSGPRAVRVKDRAGA